MDYLSTSVFLAKNYIAHNRLITDIFITSLYLVSRIDLSKILKEHIKESKKATSVKHQFDIFIFVVSMATLTC